MFNDIKNKYLKENIIISHSERLNSPFYSLIATLKRYSLHQATTHDLAKILDKTLNTITFLLEEPDENTGEPEQKLALIDTLETLGGIILELIRSVYLDEKVNNPEEFITLISGFDLRFLDIRKKMAGEMKEEQITDDNLICSIFESLPDREMFDGFFIELKELTEKYSKGSVDERSFLDRAVHIKQSIGKIRGEYENEYVNAGEWSLEASPGDNLLLEALDDWEKSMDYFSDIFSTDFRDQFVSGLRLADEGNRKLAMIKASSHKAETEPEL